jgi:hypothetical protein
VGEHLPGFVSKGTPRRVVRYLRSEEARAPYLVTIDKDGLLRSARGRLLNCQLESIAIVDDAGNLFVRNSAALAREKEKENQTRPSFAHSTFLGGDPTPMAFELHVRNGRVLYIKNRSGHYRPSRIRFMSWLVQIEERGLDLSLATVGFDPQSTAED